MTEESFLSVLPYDVGDDDNMHRLIVLGEPAERRHFTELYGVRLARVERGEEGIRDALPRLVGDAGDDFDGFELRVGRLATVHRISREHEYPAEYGRNKAGLIVVERLRVFGPQRIIVELLYELLVRFVIVVHFE